MISSSEVHDKGDPFHVGRSRETLGDFGQVTSCNPLSKLFK